MIIRAKAPLRIVLASCGFFMFYCPDNTIYTVIPELQKLGGEFRRFRFTNLGAESWIVK